MPQGRPSDSSNKEALNALVDLYYLYSDLVTHLRNYSESPQELDLFFTRPGGLKHLLHKYFELASPDPVEAGSHVGELTLELMLPRDNGISFYRAHDDLWQQIVDVNSDLKGYNREMDAVGTPVPQEVMEVVRQGRELIASRTKRTRSGADVSLVDIASAVIAYQDHTLHIGSISLPPLESNSLMDLVTDYMVNQKTKGEQVDVDVIITWLEAETMGPRVSGSQGVKDACRAVNEKVKEKLCITQDFYNTGVANKIIRNY